MMGNGVGKTPQTSWFVGGQTVQNATKSPRPPANLPSEHLPRFPVSQGMESKGNVGATNKKIRKKKDIQITKLKEQNDNLRQELDDAYQLQVAQSDEIQQLRQQAAELRTRLSKVASDRLTDNNPNIADLSDGNRATKLGERFSELYSNEWSDAYEELTANKKHSEKEAIELLLNIVEAIFCACKKKAMDEMRNLKGAILEFTGKPKFGKDLAMSLKLYKEERKKNYKQTIPNLEEVVSAFAPNESNENSAIGLYAKEATEICWLMCIQDPPLELRARCIEGAEFNSNFFNAYTIRSSKFDYLVWPALLLHKNGPLLQKGVAQGMKVHKKAWDASEQEAEQNDIVVGKTELSRSMKHNDSDILLSSFRAENDENDDRQENVTNSLPLVNTGEKCDSADEESAKHIHEKMAIDQIPEKQIKPTNKKDSESEYETDQSAEPKTMDISVTVLNDQNTPSNNTNLKKKNSENNTDINLKEKDYSREPNEQYDTQGDMENSVLKTNTVTIEGSLEESSVEGCPKHPVPKPRQRHLAKKQAAAKNNLTGT